MYWLFNKLSVAKINLVNLHKFHWTWFLVKFTGLENFSFILIEHWMILTLEVMIVIVILKDKFVIYWLIQSNKKKTLYLINLLTQRPKATNWNSTNEIVQCNSKSMEQKLSRKKSKFLEKNHKKKQLKRYLSKKIKELFSFQFSLLLQIQSEVSFNLRFWEFISVG